MVYYYLFGVFSIFVKYYFHVSFNLKVNYVRGQNNSKYRNGAPLRREKTSEVCFLGKFNRNITDTILKLRKETLLYKFKLGY